MTQCPIRPKVGHEVVAQFIGEALHAKQAESIADATVGALHAPTASIAAIGRASARARGKHYKHAIKQVDRMLSNDRIRTVFDHYVRGVVGGREIVACGCLGARRARGDDREPPARARVTAKRATAIVALRVRLGRFRAIEDLLKVKGIGRATVGCWLSARRSSPPAARDAAPTHRVASCVQMKHSIAAVSFRVGASLALFSTPAAAADIGDVEVAAKIGGGSPGFYSGYNPLALGLGGRAGASWRGKVYFGASFVDYFGEETVVTVGWCPSSPCPVGRLSAHSILFGAEGGYGLKVLDLVTVRPQVGAGDLVLMASGSAVSNGSATTHHFYLEPGLTALVPIHSFFVGADGNALWLAADSTTSVVFTAHAQVGMKF